MTEREKKRAEEILCGKSPGIVVSLIMTAILMLFVLLLVLWLWSAGKIKFLNSIGEMLGVLLVFVFFIAVFAIIIDLIVGYFVHCNYLKQQFDNLPKWKKEKLLILAYNYGNRKQIYVEENYIYGRMTEQRHGRKRGVYTITFRYIDLSEIVWAYRIERSIAMTSANSAMSTPPNVVPYDKKLRLYTRDGRYFQGNCSEKHNQKLFEVLMEKNPSCKLGYKKEWEKEICLLRAD